MVDPVSTITKIVEAALKIKNAADTVKQNEDACKQIKVRVEILSITLSQHQDNTDLMNNFAVKAALEALDETLDRALKLVGECQQDTNFVVLFCKAGNLSQRLIKMEQRISNANMDAMLSIMGFLLPQQNSSGRQGPPHAMQPPNPPEQMRRQSQDGSDVNVQISNNLGGYFLGRNEEYLPWDEVNTPVTKVDPVRSNSQWDSSVDTLCSCCAMVEKHKHVRRPSSTPDGQPLSLLQQIAELALDIKEASETVLQHEEDCIELDKRVSKVSALLSQLENTEMVENQAMKDELNKLLDTFRCGHTLVMICQRSGIVTTLVCSPPCTLSKQLSALLDQLVPHVNAIIAVIVNSTLRPQRRYTPTRNVSDRPGASQSIPQPARSILRGNAGGSQNNDASCSSGARGDAPEQARVIPRLEDQEQEDNLKFEAPKGSGDVWKFRQSFP